MSTDLMLIADQTSVTADEMLSQLKLHATQEIDSERAKLDLRAQLEYTVEQVYEGYTDRARDTLTVIWNRCGYKPVHKRFSSGLSARSHDFSKIFEEHGHRATFCRICDMPELKTRQQVSALHLARKLIEKDLDAGLLILEEDEASYLETLWIRAYPTSEHKLPEAQIPFLQRIRGVVEGAY